MAAAAEPAPPQRSAPMISIDALEKLHAMSTLPEDVRRRADIDAAVRAGSKQPALRTAVAHPLFAPLKDITVVRDKEGHLKWVTALLLPPKDADRKLKVINPAAAERIPGVITCVEQARAAGATTARILFDGLLPVPDDFIEQCGREGAHKRASHASGAAQSRLSFNGNSITPALATPASSAPVDSMETDDIASAARRLDRVLGAPPPVPPAVFAKRVLEHTAKPFSLPTACVDRAMRLLMDPATQESTDLQAALDDVPELQRFRALRWGTSGKCFNAAMNAGAARAFEAVEQSDAAVHLAVVVAVDACKALFTMANRAHTQHVDALEQQLREAELRAQAAEKLAEQLRAAARPAPPPVARPVRAVSLCDDDDGDDVEDVELAGGVVPIVPAAAAPDLTRPQPPAKRLALCDD